MAKRFTEQQVKQWQAALPKKKVAVKVILQSNQGNVLLVKPDYKDTWQLPGGGVDEYEDPKQAAVRETKEETGIVITTNDLQLVDSIFKPKEDYLFLLFACINRYAEDADYAVEDEEIEAYKFVPPVDVADLLPEYYKPTWERYIAKSDCEELVDHGKRPESG